jgi:histidinol dehydrogenase
MKIVKNLDEKKNNIDEEIKVARKILNEVKKNGDKAIKKYSLKFDKVRLGRLQVTKKEISAAYRKVDKRVLYAIKKAAANIRKFAREQYKQLNNFEMNISGNKIGQKVVAIERVGCYVPGGVYPLPSSALMTVIPAKVAECKEVIVCSPKIKAETIVAADVAGADKIFRIGGIQAIAAMAYGSESIVRVNKIVGPGNKYVTAAKKEVYGSVGVDFIAGPSEIMIIADKSCSVKFVAADLLAQAEHDVNAKCWLIVTSKRIALQVKKEIERQVKDLVTKDIASKSIKNGKIIVVKNLHEGMEIANKVAPEHLELQIRDSRKFTKGVRNYGSLFVGKRSAEVFGDYCSGTNHVLPTSGAARYTSGLSVLDFVKVLTYQKITKKGLVSVRDIASSIAKVEGLDGHRKAALARVI